MRRGWFGGAVACALVLAWAAPAGASPVLVFGEWCTSGSSSSGVNAEVTGLADGTPVTFTITGGGQTIGPDTFQSYQGSTGSTVGFGRRVEEVRVEAIVRDDGDAVVEPGEQVLRATVSRPCFSHSK